MAVLPQTGAKHCMSPPKEFHRWPDLRFDSFRCIYILPVLPVLLFRFLTLPSNDAGISFQPKERDKSETIGPSARARLQEHCWIYFYSNCVNLLIMSDVQ